MTDLDEDTRLKLIGLRAVAQDLWKQIGALEKAAARLVGEPENLMGHASDFLAGEGPQHPEELWARTSQYREATK